MVVHVIKLREFDEARILTNDDLIEIVNINGKIRIIENKIKNEKKHKN